MTNLCLFFVHAKFMKLSMRTRHVICDLLTKWYTRIHHILTAIPFLSPAMLEF
jgi:hypothetical protein